MVGTTCCATFARFTDTPAEFQKEVMVPAPNPITPPVRAPSTIRPETEESPPISFCMYGLCVYELCFLESDDGVAIECVWVSVGGEGEG